MSVPQPTRLYTPQEYLSRERDAVERHEYYHGEIFAMSGGSPQHSLIIANVIRTVGNALEGKPCRIYEGNLRIRVPKTTLFTYLDASVICGELELDPLDSQRQTVLNPKTIIEVLSPTTEAYDRGTKFQSYQQIATLMEYVLISQSGVRIETFLRQSDGQWLYTDVSGIDAVARLVSIGIELSLSRVYSGVTIVPPTNE